MFFLLLLVTNASLVLLHPFSRSRLLLVAVIYGAVTLLILYLLFHPRNQWLVANRSRVGGAGCVALTFDDGPDPVDTPKLLDLLREKGVKATFFVVGKRADQYPEIVHRAWAEGHLVANHTWSHYSLFCFLMPRRLRDEIERGTESVPLTYSNSFWRSRGISALSSCKATSTRKTSKALTLWRRSSSPKWRKQRPDIYDAGMQFPLIQAKVVQIQ